MDAIDLLLKHNDDERRALIEVLVDGGVKDFAEYRHICGVIRGLNLADASLRDLAKRMTPDDDSD
jgi:hypothetical protein